MARVSSLASGLPPPSHVQLSSCFWSLYPVRVHLRSCQHPDVHTAHVLLLVSLDRGKHMSEVSVLVSRAPCPSAPRTEPRVRPLRQTDGQTLGPAPDGLFPVTHAEPELPREHCSAGITHCLNPRVPSCFRGQGQSILFSKCSVVSPGTYFRFTGDELMECCAYVCKKAKQSVLYNLMVNRLPRPFSEMSIYGSRRPEER